MERHDNFMSLIVMALMLTTACAPTNYQRPIGRVPPIGLAQYPVDGITVSEGGGTCPSGGGVLVSFHNGLQARLRFGVDDGVLVRRIEPLGPWRAATVCGLPDGTHQLWFQPVVSTERGDLPVVNANHNVSFLGAIIRVRGGESEAPVSFDLTPMTEWVEVAAANEELAERDALRWQRSYASELHRRNVCEQNVVALEEQVRRRDGVIATLTSSLRQVMWQVEQARGELATTRAELGREQQRTADLRQRVASRDEALRAARGEILALRNDGLGRAIPREIADAIDSGRVSEAALIAMVRALNGGRPAPSPGATTCNDGAPSASVDEGCRWLVTAAFNLGGATLGTFVPAGPVARLAAIGIGWLIGESTSIIDGALGDRICQLIGPVGRASRPTPPARSLRASRARSEQVDRDVRVRGKASTQGTTRTASR